LSYHPDQQLNENASYTFPLPTPLPQPSYNAGIPQLNDDAVPIPSKKFGFYIHAFNDAPAVIHTAHCSGVKHDFALEDAIGSHACSLEALAYV
jgi:hypothetical protein